MVHIWNPIGSAQKGTTKEPVGTSREPNNTPYFRDIPQILGALILNYDFKYIP